MQSPLQDQRDDIVAAQFQLRKVKALARGSLTGAALDHALRSLDLIDEFLAVQEADLAYREDLLKRVALDRAMAYVSESDTSSSALPDRAADDRISP